VSKIKSTQTVVKADKNAVRESAALSQSWIFRPTHPQWSDLKAIKAHFSTKYLGNPLSSDAPGRSIKFAATSVVSPPALPDENVVGVGIGEKITHQGPLGYSAIIFYVKVKYPTKQLSKKTHLPQSIDGYPTDIVEVGVLRPFTKKKSTTATARTMVTAQLQTDVNPRNRIRPAPPGSSVGFRDPQNQFTMAGTFGALVRDSSGTTYILSNNHVLADESTLPSGSPIYQPGLLDRGRVAYDQIAALAKFVPLDKNGPNKVDAAIARVLRPDLVTDKILQIGKPLGKGDADFDMNVHKFGRTTGYTVGRITGIDTDVTIQYDAGPILFQSQITIASVAGTKTTSPFSKAGDSGSLIVERKTGLAVGLLFAGSDQRTIANHISDVFAALDIDLA
jgi:S1-C subfamily serine protease